MENAEGTREKRETKSKAFGEWLIETTHPEDLEQPAEDDFWSGPQWNVSRTQNGFCKLGHSLAQASSSEIGQLQNVSSLEIQHSINIDLSLASTVTSVHIFDRPLTSDLSCYELVKQAWMDAPLELSERGLCCRLWVRQLGLQSLS